VGVSIGAFAHNAFLTGTNVMILKRFSPKKSKKKVAILPYFMAKLINLGPRGRCYYDHNFLRFLPIFGVKIGVFSKANVMVKFLQKLVVVGAKSANTFAKFFGEIFKIITSAPGARV
jgi:hypothetical protein